MKVIVTGSREWPHAWAVKQALDLSAEVARIKGEPLTVVHGRCPTGADAIAQQWVDHFALASLVRVTARQYPADWRRFGPSAGPRRNRQMVDENLDASYVLAFPLGASRGTRGCMAYAHDRGLAVLDLGG